MRGNMQPILRQVRSLNHNVEASLVAGFSLFAGGNVFGNGVPGKFLVAGDACSWEWLVHVSLLYPLQSIVTGVPKPEVRPRISLFSAEADRNMSGTTWPVSVGKLIECAITRRIERTRAGGLWPRFVSRPAILPRTLAKRAAN
jgi:hypothetical protein